MRFSFGAVFPEIAEDLAPSLDEVLGKSDLGQTYRQPSGPAWAVVPSPRYSASGMQAAATRLGSLVAEAVMA